MKNIFVIDKSNFEETRELLNELFDENKRFRMCFWRIIMQCLNVANVDQTLTLTVEVQKIISCVIHSVMDAHEKEQIIKYYKYSSRYKPSLSECFNYLTQKNISNKHVIDFIEIINSLVSLDGRLSLLCNENFVVLEITIPPLS